MEEVEIRKTRDNSPLPHIHKKKAVFGADKQQKNHTAANAAPSASNPENHQLIKPRPSCP